MCARVRRARRRPLGSIPWVERACGGAGVGRGGGYAQGCLATPRSLLATVDFSLGARRIAVAAAAASARYSLVTADEPYMTRRRMARRAVSHETGSMGYDTWDTREMRAP